MKLIIENKKESEALHTIYFALNYTLENLSDAFKIDFSAVPIARQIIETMTLIDEERTNYNIEND